MKKLCTIAALLLLSLTICAEEGMWLLNQLKELGLEKNGFEIPAEAIYSPDKPSITDAIVLLNGGTAEIISADGLMLTNHHVAFGAVQRASTKGVDYITNGFLAKTRAEEIEAPGYSARILTEQKDITVLFKKFGKIKDLQKREKAITDKMDKIERETEKGNKYLSARVNRMYSGKQYILSVYKKYDDVRVAFVPPAAVGNYGAEIDNFEWPRHTGDFSFMRIYMAPDGSGRKFHKENIPFKPRQWLKLGIKGLKKGDQTFIMGFPGRTTRYRSACSVKENLHHGYPLCIKHYKEVLDILKSFRKDSQVAAAKMAGAQQGLENYMKKYQGNVDNMTNTNFLQTKIEFEKELMAFLKKDPALFKKYGGILEKIKEQYEIISENRDADDFFSLSARLGGTAFRAAGSIYEIVAERAKPKKLRSPGFSEAGNKRTLKHLGYRFLSFYEPADKVLLGRMLKKAVTLFEKPAQMVKASGLSIEAYVDNVFKETKLKDIAFVKSLYSKTRKELDSLNDPILNLVAAVYPDLEAYNKLNDKMGAILTELRAQYIEALYAWKGSRLYPDGDRTIRFSFGRVKGYSPRDAVWNQPFTTLKGMLEKDTGTVPFNMPQGLKDIYAKRDFGRWEDQGLKDVPIAFLHMVDSTNGSSGSPVMNAAGELVGILFDGNYESIAADWQFDNSTTRSISVDIRYVLLITEKLAGASHIMKELGL
ncbi:MAG: S46 family peptidase [bacterium]|nr:S46 family peptidase [bacterium]